jgi:lysyl-tRNA synthetase class II
MQKISFYYLDINFTLKELLENKISDYNKLKIMLESIHRIKINSRDQGLKTKNYLDLKFKLLMSMYYIYHNYNPNCQMVLNLISDIKDSICNPSKISIEGLLLYSRFDMVPIVKKYKKNNNQEELKVEQFKNCIFNIIHSIEYSYKCNKIPDLSILNEFIDAIGKAHAEEVHYVDFKNQIRICYKFLENNYKERI